MTFDDTVTLIKLDNTIQDEYGNNVPTEIKREVFCQELSVGRNEFYAAGSQGFKPTHLLVIHEFEYENEELVEFNDTRLSILKVYKNKDYLELTVGEKIGN